MARPLFCNIFLRLPPATAVLLLSAVFSLTDGYALPRQTKVVAYHELDVTPFPPIPTGEPLSPFDLKRRQENTICGYIGGNPDLPATCSLGSHCVLDAAVSVVGCCPNGVACTTGVFTGCVDRNSDPQTEINPYVYTCQGTDVCFMNNFAGGYFQYGCGTASSLGTTVQTSADGATAALSIETVDMSLTESPSLLTAPTTIGSFVSTETSSQLDPTASSPTVSPTSISSPSTSPITSTDSSISTTSPSTTSSIPETSTTSSTSSSHSTSKTRSSSSTLSTPSNHISSPTTGSPTPTATGGSRSAKQSQTGAIVGGVVGGAVAAISLVALVFFCLRRRNRNRRTGPGPEPTAPPTTQYISPMRSHGAAFAPLPSWHDDEGSPSPNFHSHSHPQPPEPYGPLESAQAVSSSNFRGHPGSHQPGPYGQFEPSLPAPAPANLGATAHGYSQPLRYHPGYIQQPKGSLTPVVEEEQSFEREEPPGREIDDFSRAYSSAGIGQLTDEDVEDRTPLRNNTQYEDSASRRSPGHRPLWQQNRQQSRNLMWL
ncbi:hypothetical protein FHL15_002525 [Xylaria flabelliformis]|uniref:Mid2 domain-containing protein n=1 Tax=Xylaria flabelliformis TaxID=2512241 RepID=A0A553I8U2_9PEZI|nr:hypothetical protein FHL15_002525 [Xylaria flabelliformis]